MATVRLNDDTVAFGKCGTGNRRGRKFLFSLALALYGGSLFKGSGKSYRSRQVNGLDASWEY